MSLRYRVGVVLLVASVVGASCGRSSGASGPAADVHPAAARSFQDLAVRVTNEHAGAVQAIERIYKLPDAPQFTTVEFSDLRAAYAEEAYAFREAIAGLGAIAFPSAVAADARRLQKELGGLANQLDVVSSSPTPPSLARNTGPELTSHTESVYQADNGLRHDLGLAAMTLGSYL